eukprot:Rmarinus@m.21715
MFDSNDFLTTYVLVGIGSWGVSFERTTKSGECAPLAAKVFTSVSLEMEWIVGTLNDLWVSGDRPIPRQCWFAGTKYLPGRIWTLMDSELHCTCTGTGVVCRQSGGSTAASAEVAVEAGGLTSGS